MPKANCEFGCRYKDPDAKTCKLAELLWENNKRYYEQHRIRREDARARGVKLHTDPLELYEQEWDIAGPYFGKCALLLRYGITRENGCEPNGAINNITKTYGMFDSSKNRT